MSSTATTTTTRPATPRSTGALLTYRTTLTSSSHHSQDTTTSGSSGGSCSVYNGSADDVDHYNNIGKDGNDENEDKFKSSRIYFDRRHRKEQRQQQRRLQVVLKHRRQYHHHQQRFLLLGGITIFFSLIVIGQFSVMQQLHISPLSSSSSPSFQNNYDHHEAGKMRIIDREQAGLPSVMINEVERNSTEQVSSSSLSSHQEATLTNIVTNGNVDRMTTTTTTKSSKLSCNDMFGWDTIVKVMNGTCIKHTFVKWHSCQLGTVWVDKSKIDGSKGGDDVTDVSVTLRDTREELLTYDAGALLLLMPSEMNDTKDGDQSQTLPLPPIMLSSDQRSGAGFDVKMIQFLNSFKVINDNDGGNVKRIGTNSSNGNNNYDDAVSKTDTDTATFLVRRGDYVNPCFAIITMYHVFLAMEKFGLTQSRKNIVWLDGHARGDLDVVWQDLFDTTPKHILQLSSTVDDDSSNSHIVRLDNAIVINSKSHLGDEGMVRYRWRYGSRQTLNCTLHPQSNTLVAFRDFVLEKYGLHRKKKNTVGGTTINATDNNSTNNAPDTASRPTLTLLVRKDYVSHPRSNGKTDRVLANATDDALYIQSKYENHSVSVVSFEGMEFRKQLEIVTQSDVLVAVHGAGNIHAWFLPDHATFVEYFPSKFQGRKRFRYISECLNLTYESETAYIVDRFEGSTKVSVRLRPRPKHPGIFSQKDMMALLDVGSS
jgi:Glycosyltransferase 61